MGNSSVWHTRIAGNAFKYAVMAVVLAISLYPMLWMLLSSFKSRMDIMESPLKLPTQLYLEGYRIVLTGTPILTFFKNSFIVSICATALNILAVCMAAYVIARFEFKFKNAVVAMFASTLFIPTLAISFPIFYLIQTLGLYNTKTGLVFTYTGLAVAVTFFILRSFILSIPKELDEAARIDGAGYVRIFVRMILPLARPGIATAAILTFLTNWNEFYYALLLTGGEEARTLPVLIFYFTSQFRGNLGAMFASMIIIITPTIVIYSLASEQIVESLTAGAVKG